MPGSSSRTFPTDSRAMARRGDSILLKELARTPFANQTEFDYFKAWRGVCVGLSNEFFPSDMYTRTIPQLGHDEPAIIQAALAVGCISKALAPSQHHRVQIDSPHYKNALVHYGRALRLVQRELEPSKKNERGVRTAILCCVLFVCFESLNNNLPAAKHHIGHGLSILNHFANDHGKDGYLSAMHSPAPYVVDNDIVQLFQRLDFHAWSTHILVPRSDPPSPCCMDSIQQELHEEIPDKFEDLEEARKYCDLVAHYALNYNRILAILRRDHAQTLGAKSPLELSDVPQWKALQKRYVEALQNWSDAFGALYQESCDNKHADQRGYLAAITLQTQYLVVYCSTRSVCFSEYSLLCSLSPQFREINRLQAIILEHGQLSKDSDEPFTLDNGPALALFITCTKCRDPEVREESVRLLWKYPRRDGVWDSRAVAGIGQWSNEMEKEYAELDIPVEKCWEVLRCRQAIYDEDGLGCRISGYRKHPVTGEWYMREDHISWA